MTVINLIVKDGAAYMLADTAVYRRDGRLCGFADKTSVSARLGMMIASSGGLEDGRAMDDELMRYASFDQAVAEFPEWLRDEFSDRSYEERFRVFIAGWSRTRGRVEMYSMQSHSTNNGSSKEAFVVTQDEWIALQPGPTLDEMRAAGIVTGQKFAVGEPVAFLTKLVDWQRTFTEDGIFRCGGSAVLTKLDKAGVTQRVVKHWSEDAIGEMIAPRQNLDAEQQANEGEGMSRLKRDMLAKKARRGMLRVVS